MTRRLFPPAGPRPPLAEPIHAAVIPDETKTRVYFLRRGTLYGAALGMLAGLARVAIAGWEGTQAVEVWRNWILAGACAGLLAGTVRAVFFKSDDDDHNV